MQGIGGSPSLIAGIESSCPSSRISPCEQASSSAAEPASCICLTSISWVSISAADFFADGFSAMTGSLELVKGAV
jgi:hypothetical protein